MKKIKSIAVILLIVALIVSFVPVSVHATETTMKDLVKTADNDSADLGEGMNGMVIKVLKYIRGIAVAAALISVLVIGVKMIIGSADEKAKYKEMLLPLAIGIIIVVFGTTIIQFLFSLKGE